MELNLKVSHHPALVLECLTDGVRFSSGILHRPVIIHYRSEEIQPSEQLPDHPLALREEHFSFLDQTPDETPFEVLVLGTGERSIWLAAPISAAIERRRIGVEIASTRSASSIFNVLLADQRRVAAMLYPPDCASG